MVADEAAPSTTYPSLSNLVTRMSARYYTFGSFQDNLWGIFDRFSTTKCGHKTTATHDSSVICKPKCIPQGAKKTDTALHTPMCPKYNRIHQSVTFEEPRYITAHYLDDI